MAAANLGTYLSPSLRGRPRNRNLALLWELLMRKDIHKAKPQRFDQLNLERVLVEKWASDNEAVFEPVSMQSMSHRALSPACCQ